MIIGTENVRIGDQRTRGEIRFNYGIPCFVKRSTTAVAVVLAVILGVACQAAQLCSWRLALWASMEAM